jgi:hypothetical protein
MILMWLLAKLHMKLNTIAENYEIVVLMKDYFGPYLQHGANLVHAILSDSFSYLKILCIFALKIKGFLFFYLAFEIKPLNCKLFLV